MIESFNKKELEEKIDQYINGQLSASEVDELWAELIQDGYHLDYLKSAANLKAVVERRRKERQSSDNRQYWYYAAAAVIALLIAVVGVMNMSWQSDSASIEPVTSIELDYYRSGEGTIDADNKSDVIQNAIRLANTGQVEQAISLLNSELQNATSPRWVAELSLNVGSLYYNNGSYEQAIQKFDQVIAELDNAENLTANDKLMLEKAYWYTGNAYFHMDKLAEAQSSIEKAYEMNGAYRRVAQSYLDALSE